ncbi:MAG: hypothetical protein BGO84_01480 [Dysgonomonas sp. 37-18]|nr:MAG: hypothetical protein BGO84_01480 [Dysgonomonas sp. 37-18]
MLDLTTSFFLYLGLKGITYTTTKTDTMHAKWTTLVIASVFAIISRPLLIYLPENDELAEYPQ